MKPPRSTWSRPSFLLATIGVFASPLAAQRPEPDPGTVSPQAAPDLRRLAYLTGEWTVQNFMRDSSGTFVEIPTRSYFRARYLRNGLSLMEEFFEADPDGFHGIHIVTFDPARGLVHRYFDAHRNQRSEFVGHFEGNRYHITSRGGYGGKGDFLYRETDSEITPSGFVKRLYRSEDEGRTWVEGNYYYRFTRTR